MEGNGPVKPDNPPVQAGRVPIPADYAFRKMRGLCNECSTPENAGAFLCLLKTLPCPLPESEVRIRIHIEDMCEMERKETVNEQLYA